jgi:predicted NBD/HSP70 family sugar kinase
VEHPEFPAGRNDAKTEPIVHAHVVGWDETTFASLAERLRMPLLIDNGAKTTTQAEVWFGAARDVDHAIVVLIGDGVGAGIVTNGRLFRGSSSTAGEWGHTKISLDGPPCRCGSHGCVETFIGASAFVASWQRDEQARVGHEMEDVDALLAAYRSGDSAAASAVERFIDHLGISLSNLVNLYNPTRIVIAGWLGDLLAAEFLPEIAASTARSSLPQPGAEVTLVRSQLGLGAVALGAATLPLDRFIEYGWPDTSPSTSHSPTPQRSA